MKPCSLIPGSIPLCVLVMLSFTSYAQRDSDTLIIRGRHTSGNNPSLFPDTLYKNSLQINHSAIQVAGIAKGEYAFAKRRILLQPFTKQLSTDLPGGMRMPVQLNQPFLGISESTVNMQLGNNAVAPSGEQYGTFQFTDISTNVTVWGIPFSFGYHADYSNDFNNNRLALNATKFDKEKYLEQLRQRIGKMAQPEELFSKEINELYSKRDVLINRMQHDFSGMIKSGNSKLVNELAAKFNATNLARLGAEQLLSNILTEQTALLTQQQEKLMKAQREKVGGSLSGDSVNALNTEVVELMQVKEQLESRLPALKDEWQKKGMFQMVSGFEREKQSLINKLLQDPKVISTIAAKKLKLSGLQKLLLNTNTLDLGASGTKQQPLGLNNALLKGARFDFFKNNKFFAPVIGSQPGIKNIQDFSYSNFNNLANVFTAGLRLGKGDMSGSFTHFSFFLFQENNNQLYTPGNIIGSLPQNFVTTFSKNISLGANHRLLTEVSKSTIVYKGGSAVSNSDGFKSLAGENGFFENMGLNLNYSGEFPDLKLTENFTVKYTGREYNNLGNAFMSGGTKEIANALNKQLLNRKLIIGIRGQYREYDLGMDGRKWQNFSWLTDIKWKFRNGEFLEARYQPYSSRRVEPSVVYASSKSNRFALRGNINRKIGRGLSYRNFIECSTAKDEWLDVVLNKLNINQTFSFTTLQTLALGRQTLFANCIVNRTKNNTAYLFMNSSCSLDAGSSFAVRRQILLSSSLVYSEVNHFYGQLAIRQSISTQIGNHFTMDGFIQAGKNLYQPEFIPIPAVTGNIAFHYSIK